MNGFLTEIKENLRKTPLYKKLRTKNLRTKNLLVIEVDFLCQFHQHFTQEFFVQKFVQSQTLSREKLLKRLLYEK
jgi:hypothetical protein